VFSLRLSPLTPLGGGGVLFRVPHQVPRQSGCPSCTVYKGAIPVLSRSGELPRMASGRKHGLLFSAEARVHGCVLWAAGSCPLASVHENASCRIPPVACCSWGYTCGGNALAGVSRGPSVLEGDPAADIRGHAEFAFLIQTWVLQAQSQPTLSRALHLRSGHFDPWYFHENPPPRTNGSDMPRAIQNDAHSSHDS